MKICFIELQPFPTTIGGGITHLNELSKELIRIGHEVSIITSQPEKEFKLDSGLEKLNLYHVGMIHKKLGDYKGIWRIYYYVWRIIFETCFIIGTNKILRNNEFDIINPQSPITTSLPCSLFKRKFFITAHGVHNKGFSRLYKEKKEFFVSSIASVLYRLMEKFNIKKARGIICLGRDTFDYYSKFNKCVIIPNGVDSKRFSSKSRERKKLIVSIGRLTEQKAVDKLILAMDKLPDYKLNIIGLGDLEEQIKDLCKERKNCQFLGYKAQEEIIPYLREARFTILPSLFEGLPISMLEAMSCGVIPIATGVGDILSVVKEGKTGFVLRNSSPEEIVEVVRKAERKNLKEISSNCSDMIRKNYSWHKIARQYLKAWKTS